MSDMTNIMSNSTKAAYCRVLSANCRDVRELEEIGIFGAGEAALGAPYEMKRLGGSEKQHTAVWFVLEGELAFEIPGQSFSVSPGMAIVHSSAINRFCQVKTGVFRHLFFHLPYRDIETRAFHSVHCHDLQHLLSMLDRELADPESDAERKKMLAALISSYLEKELGRASEPDRLREMAGLIESRLDMPWTTKLLAEELHISPSLLYQLCLRYYGESPGDVVRDIKFRRAATMLRHMDMSLDAVASMIGYGSAFSFSKAYTKHTGRRPGQERMRKSV